MPILLTDAQIAVLLAEPKPLPEDWRARMQLKAKRGHKERELRVTGANKSEFRVILRQADENALDFSVILAYQPPDSNQVFKLRRYNGKSHEHTNTLEGKRFYDFHVHTATERYQGLGVKEEWYAEPTDRFADFHGAVQCMLSECGFVVPSVAQGRLL